jgi:hypothetical protein
MRKYRLLVFIILVLVFSNVYSQEYFQQEVKYKISVTLNDSLHTLKAFETIVYKNNSPKVLNEIYIHLWPNAYKNNETPFAEQLIKNHNTEFYYSKEKDRGCIKDLDFKVDENAVRVIYEPKAPDICKLVLNYPLNPGDSVIITTPFTVLIPDASFSRLGHDGQSYYISQWYPKPAVYDKNGWHAFSYLDQGEFYSEYGSFDVSITLPKNYIVASTGLLTDESEKKWLDEQVIVTANKPLMKSDDLAFPASDKQNKTISYHQDKIHDFAWFADKRFNVRKSKVVLPNSKRTVTTWAMFTNEDAYSWLKATDYANDAITYYSKWVGDYAYDECTVVQGNATNGGMEYPMITVIGKTPSAFMLEEVIMHEVGHNWFYGMLGSNERENPWMDEGINTFYELRYIKTKYPDAKLASLAAEITGMNRFNKLIKMLDIQNFPERSLYEIMYLLSARNNLDQPANLSADKYTSLNYNSIVYCKNAMSFNYLMNYLGEDKFDSIMQKYFKEWEFKHPSPEDLKKLFLDETGKDLSWFFNDLISTSKKLDYKIKKFRKKRDENDNLIVVVKNKGMINSPFSVSSVKDGKTTNITWFDGFSGKKDLKLNYNTFDKITIDGGWDSPDINRKNNSIKSKGACKKSKKLRLQFLASLDNPDKTQIFFSPVMGYNYYNGYMLGMAFYSNFLFPKNWDYMIMPMFAFKNLNLAGSANIGYTIKPYNSAFRNIRIGVLASQYNYMNEPYKMNYNRIIPQISIDFRNRNATSLLVHKLKLRSINILRQSYGYTRVDTAYEMQKTHENYYVNDLTYYLLNTRPVNPFSFIFDLQQGDKMMKLSVEGNYRISYNKKKGFDIRLFAGTFLMKPENSVYDYRFRLSGTNGYNDYMYDNTFLGRSETSGFLSQQFVDNDGAFKSYTPIGQSWDWLVTLNLKIAFPWKIPLKFYGDIGTFANAGDGTYSDSKVLYDGGISLVVINNIFEVYFPFLWSPDIKKTNELYYTNYWQKIRFIINFDKLNPVDLTKKIEFF